ncbi:uncharacterized protein LOC101855813 [Aplysia californica]|uniref:Uncharacterized protein LOC101855813 n=1 Tax=Aplysia californica TaxID=6500 RepID=A0ABM0JZY6_APLCA|nr:uncharacterized protein LOC101855813 [Aplysia californica]
MEVYKVVLVLLGIAAHCHGFSEVSNIEKRSSSCRSTMVCLAPVPMLVELVEKDFVSGLGPLTYEVLLDRVCGQQNEIQRCVSRTRCRDPHRQYTGQAVVDILGYICGQGREAFLREKACISRDDLEESMQRCADIFRIEIDLTQTQVYSGLAYASSYCTTINNNFKCIQRGIRRSCSERAVDVISDIYGYLHKASAEALGCSVTFSN